MNIPQGDWGPSTWSGLAAEGNPYGKGRSANMVCPQGHPFSLIDHTIAKDGKVSPSVVCPDGECNFHEFVKLEGWTSVMV